MSKSDPDPRLRFMVERIKMNLNLANFTPHYTFIYSVIEDACNLGRDDMLNEMALVDFKDE